MDSQRQTTTGKQGETQQRQRTGREAPNKQAEQRQRKAGREGGDKAHRTQPWEAEGQKRKRERKERDGKRREGVSQPLRTAPMESPGKRKVHPALLVYPRSHQRRGKGERNWGQHLMLRVLLRLVATRQNFAHTAVKIVCHIVSSRCLPWHYYRTPLHSKYFKMQTASGCWWHHTLITGKCPAITFTHVEM